MSTSCPSCSQLNRDDAKFCGKCGTVIQSTLQNPSAIQSSGTAIGPVFAQAGAVLAPVAKQAAEKGWSGSERSVSWLVRAITGGGRAAYSELLAPMPITGGRVHSVSPPTTIPTPIEPAALLFALISFSLFGVFLLPLYPQLFIVICVPLLLLVLAWFGVRRPFFTKMTISGLISRLRNRGRASHVMVQRFQLLDPASGGLQDVVAIGPWQGMPISEGATVEIWGISDSGRNELRAWRVESIDAANQPRGVFTVPRLIPLVVALFLPVILFILVWLSTLII